jgi:excinuclease ABC subunit A
VFSTLRACPVCATSYPEAGPAPVLVQQQARLVPDCVGTGVKLTRDQRKAFDDTLVGGRRQGPRADLRRDRGGGRRRRSLPGLPRQPAQPAGARRAVRPTGIAEHRRAVGARRAALGREPAGQRRAERARAGHRARPDPRRSAARLEFLEEVGLDYLTLDRGAPTLSGGEAQRIRLAAQLGSNLQGVCYVLDEPTIGLHARDNQILLNALHKLGDKGNTLVVVEHDEDTIRRADHIIDIGPAPASAAAAWSRRASRRKVTESPSR